MDLEVLVSHGIEVVITLMTTSELNKMKLQHNLPIAVRKLGMEYIHFSITDKWLPNSVDGFVKIVHEVVEQIQLGKKMLVHCNGGKGRTGLLIVACLKHLGISQTDATNKIRKARPGMLHNPAQQAYLMWVEKKLKGQEITDTSPRTGDTSPKTKRESLFQK